MVDKSADNNLKRTDRAERMVEGFLAIPLIKEFVFRSPMAIDGGIEKEVADFLITNDHGGILISQKYQLDPSARDDVKMKLWAKKEAKKGVKQLLGALRTGNNKAIWCMHPRRGRVGFPTGLPKIAHGIVLVEVRDKVELEEERLKLPLEFNGLPISYLSANDFLNLAKLLRTVPELIEYLNIRRRLSASDLRMIGDEKLIYNSYLLTNGSLEGISSRAEAQLLVDSEASKLEGLLEMKFETEIYGRLMETVAEELATRDPKLPAHMTDIYEPLETRTGYLKMQGVIASMRYCDRISLGRHFFELIESLRDKAGGFTYASARSDALENIVFILGASKKVPREELVKPMRTLVLSAMAHYRRSEGFMVVDRDGKGFEVISVVNTRESTSEEIAAGNKLFGHLRVTSRPVSVIG